MAAFVLLAGCSQTPRERSLAALCDSGDLLADGAAPLWTVGAADLDGDGVDELIAASCPSPESCPTVHVLEPEPTRTCREIFRAPVPALAGAVVRHVAVGDVDGDGRPDAVLAGTNGNTAIVSMTVDRRITVAPTGISDVQLNRTLVQLLVADTNQNGAPELVLVFDELPVKLRHTAAVFVYERDGPAYRQIFAASGLALPSGMTVVAAATGDTDDDGRPEIILGETGLEPGPFRVDRFELAPTAGTYERKVATIDGVVGLPLRPLVLDGDGGRHFLAYAADTPDGPSLLVLGADGDDHYRLLAKATPGMSRSPLVARAGTLPGIAGPLVAATAAGEDGDGAMQLFAWSSAPGRLDALLARPLGIPGRVFGLALAHIDRDRAGIVVASDATHKVQLYELR